MSEVCYNLIFTGKLRPDHDSAEVQQAFAAMTKRPPEQVQKIFSGKPVRLAQHLQEDKAKRMLQKLQALGMRCQLQPDHLPEEIQAQRAASTRSMKCPSCGRQQALAETCAECGIVIAKYQKSEPHPFYHIESEPDSLPLLRKVIRLIGLLCVLGLSLAFFIGPPAPAPQIADKSKQLRSGGDIELAAMGSRDSGLVLVSGSQLTPWRVERNMLTGDFQRFYQHQSSSVLEAEHPVTAVAFNPVGLDVASNGSEAPQEILLWDIPNNMLEQRLSGHQAAISALSFNPTGQLLASGAEDGSILLWHGDGNNKQSIGRLKLNGTIKSLVFDEQQTLLAAASQKGEVAIWLLSGLSDAHPLHQWKYPAAINVLAFSPDGKTLAAGGKDNLIHLLDAQSGAESNVLFGHQAAVTALDFREDGWLLASGSADETIKLWSLWSKHQIAHLYVDEQVNYLAFSTQGDTLYSTFDKHSIQAWTAPVPSSFAFPLRLYFSPLGIDLNYGE